jgi:hypothetical protein
MKIRIPITVHLDKSLTSLLADIAHSLREIAYWSRPNLKPVGKVSVNFKEQISMSQFRFTFNIPAPANPADVASRKLVCTVNDGTATETALAVDALVSDPMVFNESDSVKIHLVDMDAAGNPTAGDDFSFLVIDDIGPAKPGMLGIASKEQI